MAVMNERRPVAPFVFDEEGFLETPELWSRDLALGIAAELGVRELSEEHWAVVDRLREHYFATGRVAAAGDLCEALDLGAQCIETLFGGLVEALRVAGLPCSGEPAIDLPGLASDRGGLRH